MTLEQIHPTQTLNPTHKRTRPSKAAAAAAFGLVPFDVAISDSAFYRSQTGLKHISENWDLNPAAEWLFSRGTTVSIIGAQALLLGGLVTRSDGARGALEGFDAYAENRRKNMKGVRKVVSAAVNSPISLLVAVGKKFENVGKKFRENDSKVIQQVGQTAIDIGRTNSMSTTGAILYEVGNDDKAMTLRRMGRISSTFAVSWIATTEAIRGIYRGVGTLGAPGEAIQNGMGRVGRLAYELTAVGLNPAETPLASTFMGSVAVACMVAGSRAVEYNDAQKLNAPSFLPFETDPLDPAA